MDRTKDSLIKELDGIRRAQARLATKHFMGRLSDTAHGRAYDLLLKQTTHVITLLGVEGMKDYFAIQEHRAQRKSIRKIRQGIERMRVRAYGKPMAVAMSKQQAMIREGNGAPSVTQSISLSDIRRRMFEDE